MVFDMIELTEQQRQAVKNGEAVRVAVPELGEDVVLLHAAQYESMCVAAGRPARATSRPALLDEAGGEGRSGESVLTMNPGEIYMADLGEALSHPVIVVSREELNRRRHRVVAVLCTSQKFALRSPLAHCIPFRAGQFGFTKDCVAQCENIFLIDKASLSPGPLGVLDDMTLRDVVKAIGHVLDSDCEPN